MKTAKEKAIELVKLFIDNVNPYIGSGMLSNTQDDDAIFYQSKMVAGKCVDEIIKALTFTTSGLELNPLDDIEISKDFYFWKEVKEQIGLIK